MCPSGATCLPADSCFSELARIRKKKKKQRNVQCNKTEIIIISSNVTRYDKAEKMLTGVLKRLLTNSLILVSL